MFLSSARASPRKAHEIHRCGAGGDGIWKEFIQALGLDRRVSCFFCTSDLGKVTLSLEFLSVK